MEKTEEFFEPELWFNYEADGEDKRPIKRRERKHKRQKEREETLRRKRDRRKKVQK